MAIAPGKFLGDWSVATANDSISFDLIFISAMLTVRMMRAISLKYQGLAVWLSISGIIILCMSNGITFLPGLIPAYG